MQFFLQYVEMHFPNESFIKQRRTHEDNQAVSVPIFFCSDKCLISVHNYPRRLSCGL